MSGPKYLDPRVVPHEACVTTVAVDGRERIDAALEDLTMLLNTYATRQRRASILLSAICTAIAEVHDMLHQADAETLR